MKAKQHCCCSPGLRLRSCNFSVFRFYLVFDVRRCYDSLCVEANQIQVLFSANQLRRASTENLSSSSRAKLLINRNSPYIEKKLFASTLPSIKLSNFLSLSAASSSNLMMLVRAFKNKKNRN